MIDPKDVAFFVPAHLKRFKLDLFNRIGATIEKAGGCVVRGEFAALDRLPDSVVPIVGCTPELRPYIDGWTARKRTWIYWDRGALRRVFATWLPRGDNGGYYRWHINCYQMQRIRDVPDDRFKRLIPGNPRDRRILQIDPWSKGGRQIVVAEPSRTYMRFHGIEGWTERTVELLKTLTDRPLVMGDKESKIDLRARCLGAHALVTHGSIAAVEAVVMGCPVFVDPSSAAALVGLTDFSKIETPIYPERQPWLNSLAYSQWNEKELVDGTLWRLIA